MPQAIPAPATKQAAAAAPAKAAAEKPPAQLFDLLSMDDVGCSGCKLLLDMDPFHSLRI